MTKDEEGAVTAEAAVVIPLLALVAVCLVWLVCLAGTHVLAIDAAREVARAVARGDSEGEALALGREVAPEGSRFRVGVSDGRVVVAVRSPVRGPGGLFSLVGYDVRAEAVALQEGQ